MPIVQVCMCRGGVHALGVHAILWCKVKSQTSSTERTHGAGEKQACVRLCLQVCSLGGQLLNDRGSWSSRVLQLAPDNSTGWTHAYTHTPDSSTGWLSALQGILLLDT